MIYLDNSATTIPDPSVIESFQKTTEKFFANPSSIHQLGGATEKLLHAAKQQAASLLQVEPNEIIFTSGGTEGNNIAIKGIALEHQNRGKHIITTATEHPSVDEACHSLESLGFEVTVLPVDEEGRVHVNDVKEAIRNDTILVSVMHVNNELGTIQPIEEIGKLLSNYPKLYFHVDAVQSLGKVPLDIQRSRIDLCSFSGHKIHGLKGTGILYVNKQTSLFPLFHGGGQENGLRSGTENVAGAVSMGRALRLIKEKQQNETSHLQLMHDFLWEKLENMDGVQINSPKNGAPHILNLSVPRIKPEVMIHMLGKKGIYISTKSACSSKEKDESKVLAACGLPREIAVSGLRISLSYNNTQEEMERFVVSLEEAIHEFKEVLR
ncbi:cysteine desulfurase family protein [Oceanobacillus alkalisoli]|uniref:cysteine desulfurase family protein n=1 Tax=Oceanobacillus alkalisoli TaxID=2925113 RepID=UPI001F11A653|nr:cysteine desulfurase family protein [Oceanobacillus alkalisoli]MCF3943327.1 cysteine desulfurase [Oceanobacillus alkalisoli]